MRRYLNLFGRGAVTGNPHIPNGRTFQSFGSAAYLDIGAEGHRWAWAGTGREAPAVRLSGNSREEAVCPAAPKQRASPSASSRPGTRTNGANVWAGGLQGSRWALALAGEGRRSAVVSDCLPLKCVIPPKALITPLVGHQQKNIAV
jgi:hypothetical protein